MTQSFQDLESTRCVDSFERANTGLSRFTKETLDFVADCENLDYYQLLGVLGQDCTHPEYEWMVKDTADHLETAIKNFTTDFDQNVIVGSKNDPDFPSGAGIFDKQNVDFIKALKIIFTAKTLLPYDEPRRMYDAELGKKIVARVIQDQDNLSDLQILGIPIDQLPSDPNKVNEYIDNVAKLRLNQVFNASESLKPKDTIEMKDCDLVASIIEKSAANLKDDIKAATNAEYSYKEFMDLIDVRGPMWEKVASTVGVKLEDLRLISRATRKAMISLARRHPGPIALFIAVELAAPAIYDNLPKELRAKLHNHATSVRKRVGDFFNDEMIPAFTDAKDKIAGIFQR
jgi:hypothetical protein